MSGAQPPLPPLIRFDDHEGNWDKYINAVFALFHRDFIATQPKFRDKWVRIRRDPTYKGKEAGFWHCTSEGPSEHDRTPDIRRCERIAWIRFAIEHFDAPGIDCWTNHRHGEERHLIWIEEQFLVVLAKRKRERDGFEYFQLVTAYSTPEESRKQKLRRERDAARNG